jgi:7-cyano-7-deazaguanine synthase in queuosine biosynthesis
MDKIDYQSMYLDYVFKGDTDRDTEDDCSNVVMWSGGCDSTLLLYEVASHFKSLNTKVYAVSSTSPILDETKSKSESHSRDKIKAKLKELGLDNIVYITVNTDVSETLGIDPYNHPAGLPQAYFWSLESLVWTTQKCNLFMAYIRGDDFWHYKDDYYNMVYYASRLLRNGGDCIKAICPYEWITKSEIIVRLHYLGLLELVWSCELPHQVDEPCGNCTPCNHYHSALLEIMKSDFNHVHDYWTYPELAKLESHRSSSITIKNNDKQFLNKNYNKKGPDSK